MREVGAFEAKNTLGTLLDLVENGEEIVITRHGKPVARMTRETASQNRAAAVAAAESIREISKNLKLDGFDWDEWKSYRDEGGR
ncbi:type II toxin-antitoxin system Phd/YefM family antitoxin [Pararhizobium sp.]|uniref:type II toxin-antitoxin system Phd/YefM family antitoxin n=1 Tax=Pararhizobium sp. TaxID=1977563 RepID=UPI00272378A2|nr:type II toxin-antitoxin system prevent-host-death family antitoxin [Pararhizobium sp.]MDO9415807.1 type II toxin-antitoxin system prevent-host-death family antitoxin [Pararhizobium sp.]